MKTSLTFLALFLSLALPGEVFAEFVGVHVPAVLSGETTLALFASTFVLLILINDYRPRLSALPRRTGRKLAIAQPVVGITVPRSNAYGIRRSRRSCAPVSI
jgi:hypothetical protein